MERNQEEIRSLLKNIDHKIASRIHYALYDHFSDVVENAEERGLLYVAEHVIPSMSVKGIPKIDKENDNSVIFTARGKTTSEDVENSYELGTEEFYENGMADLYLGSSCGCAYADFDRLKNSIPVGLLPYGSVMEVVHVDNCGDDFIDMLKGKGVISKDHTFRDYSFRQNRFKSVDKFLSADKKTQVSAIRDLIKDELGLPDSLANRLHIIPSHGKRGNK